MYIVLLLTACGSSSVALDSPPTQDTSTELVDSDDSGRPLLDSGMDSGTTQDSGVDSGTEKVDADGDGYILDVDCDDTNATIHPNATETCNGADDNCNGAVDEYASDAPTWYADTDGDGYGNAGVTALSCTQPSGYLTTSTDCDDSNPNVNPGATETCNGIDDDCDGSTDPDTSEGAVTWYADVDGDGYGDNALTKTSCIQPADYTVDNTDCDDSQKGVNPGTTEACNGVDDDCDGDVDESSARDAATWYADADSDGYGDPAISTLSCSMPSGYSSNDDDCNDDESTMNPGGAEECGDGLDNDCDGTDNGCELTGTVSLSAYDAKLTGEASTDQAGNYFSSGDVDGDGEDDLLIAASSKTDHGSYKGGAYLVLGAASGTVGLGTADAEWTGATSGDYAGGCVTARGDLNGDGYADVVIGAEYVDNTTSNTGAVYVDYGPVGTGGSVSSMDVALTDTTLQDYAGTSVNTEGDLTGDGNDDLVIGAKGHLYIMNGPLSTTSIDSGYDGKVTLATTGKMNHQSVSTGGDLDGDGLNDLTVGDSSDSTAATSSGTTYIFFGPVSGSTDYRYADASFTGEAASDASGYSVDAEGDVDGDGYSDLVVGAYAESTGGYHAGAAYVVYGPVSGGTTSLSSADAKMVGDSAQSAYLGWSVSTGDLNDDGMDDVAAGAWTYTSTGSGRVYLYYGDLSGTVTSSDATLTEETTGDRAGSSVYLHGDYDGDGYKDLVVGAPYESTAASHAGAGYLLYGDGI